MIVSLLQPLVLDSKQKILEQVLSLIELAALRDHTDLVVLPELWNTPFINAEILKHQDEWDDYIHPLQQIAKSFSIWIVAGTLPRQEEGKLYNSCATINSDGEIVSIADKTHLLEVHTSKHTYYEKDVFTPGNQLKTFLTPWGRIGILICMDNRFPEAARTIAKDCFMIVAPCGFNDKVGPIHWNPLFQARAMENQVFYLATNPAKKSYATYTSYGHSLVVGPDGKILDQLDEKPGLLTIEIDPKQVDQIRKRTPYWDLRRTDLY